MKSKDQMLLEEAYNKVAAPQNEIIDEGVWSQIKGLGSGIVAGAKTGAQNLAAGAAKAIGVKVDDSNRQTMGQAYAKAQQGSMLKGFQSSAEKTVNDFINDAKKMGVNLNDPNIIKQFPEAAAAFKEVQNLLKYVKNPSATPASPPTPPTAAPATTPTSATAMKTRTGGKVAGQTSQTPNAIRQRAARAVKKTTKSSSAAPAPTAVPATPSAPTALTTSASNTAGFTQTSTGVSKTY